MVANDVCTYEESVQMFRDLLNELLSRMSIPVKFNRAARFINRAMIVDALALAVVLLFPEIAPASARMTGFILAMILVILWIPAIMFKVRTFSPKGNRDKAEKRINSRNILRGGLNIPMS